MDFNSNENLNPSTPNQFGWDPANPYDESPPPQRPPGPYQSPGPPSFMNYLNANSLDDMALENFTIYHAARPPEAQTLNAWLSNHHDVAISSSSTGTSTHFEAPHISSPDYDPWFTQQHSFTANTANSFADRISDENYILSPTAMQMDSTASLFNQPHLSGNYLTESPASASDSTIKSHHISSVSSPLGDTYQYTDFDSNSLSPLAPRQVTDFDEAGHTFPNYSLLENSSVLDSFDSFQFASHSLPSFNEDHIRGINGYVGPSQHTPFSHDNDSDEYDVLSQLEFPAESSGPQPTVQSRNNQYDGSPLDSEGAHGLNPPDGQQIVAETPFSDTSTLVDPDQTIAQTDVVNRSLSADSSSDTGSSSPSGTYPCKLCDKVFDKRYQLNKHDNIHNPKYQCQHHCGRAFAVKRDRDRHESDRHSPNGLYYCPVDGCKRNTKPFKRDDNLLRHLEKVHKLRRDERSNILGR